MQIGTRTPGTRRYVFRARGHTGLTDNPTSSMRSHAKRGGSAGRVARSHHALRRAPEAEPLNERRGTGKGRRRSEPENPTTS